MSKVKKAAFAEKQRTAASTAAANTMIPLGVKEAPAAPTPKKSRARKQSRGK